MIKIFIDGASAGNPGKIGIGIIFYKEKTKIFEKSIFLGTQTNNFAEYMALIFALIEAQSQKELTCKVFTDSQLLCEQINGNYQIKNQNLYPLFIMARYLIAKMDHFEIIHIRREKNSEADRLSKQAVK